MTIEYCSINDVRNYTKVQSAEYDDTSITLMIEQAQDIIDERSKMDFTTSGNSVVEYYDGSGDNIMFTRNYPIISISEIAIDDNDNETYDKVLTSDEYEIDTETGRIHLTADATISKFPAYIRGVRITYDYGYSAVPGIIKQLTILMVADMLEINPTRAIQIEDLFMRLTKARIELA